MGKLSAAQIFYQLAANVYPTFWNHVTELMAEIWSINFCSSPSSLFFFFFLFPSQKEVEESSRLYMLSLVTSISFWNSRVCMPCLYVASGSRWGAEIQFSMLWLSEELLTLCTSLFSAYYVVQRGKHECLEWSPPFGARWGVCNVHRHHVSRVQIVYLVVSGFLLYASCLNQVFPHFSSVMLFHSISILVRTLTVIKVRKYHCGL